jgi:hypothetical protein
MKQGALNHSKTFKLARLLGIEVWGARGILESLWNLTAEEAPNGGVGKLDDFAIAERIGWRKKKPEVLIAALLEAVFLERHERFRLVVHDWADHAQDAVHNKLARSGERFWDGKEPRISRLPKDERERLERVRNTTGVRTASALSPPAELVPCLTLPSLTLPSPATPAWTPTRWKEFQDQYPGEVFEPDLRLYLGVLESKADEDLLMKNLPLWKTKWNPGFYPSAENFLSKRMWKKAPRDIPPERVPRKQSMPHDTEYETPEEAAKSVRAIQAELAAKSRPGGAR